MTSKYSNLRIERWKSRANAAIAGAAVLSLAENASATPVALPQVVSAGGAKWHVVNNTYATGVASSGLGIVDASVLSPTRSDAYDGAFCIRVNGVQFTNPSGTVDLTGTTITSSTVPMSGLNTTIQYFFDPASPTVRALVSLQNPSGSPISATVLWGQDLGSDSGTTIATSSSGDALVTPADRWFISSDGATNHDPVNSFVAYGPSASVTPSATPFAPGQTAPTHQDWFSDQFNITVPAGQTRRLMFFGRLSQSTASAQSSMSTFDSTANLQSAGLLAGLTQQQESEIVNWSFASTAPVTPIPGTITLVTIGLLIAGVATRAKSLLARFRTSQRTS